MLEHKQSLCWQALSSLIVEEWGFFLIRQWRVHSLIVESSCMQNRLQVRVCLPSSFHDKRMCNASLLSASLVSCRADMSMSSRWSSASVLRAASICWRSPERPAVNVLTFQLAMQSAGNFFLFLRVFLGVVLGSQLVEYIILSFLHPKKQADRGESEPYWLGAAQLWRAVADQWDTMVFPTVGGNLWHVYSTPVEIDL